MNQPTPAATLPFTFAGLYNAALWGIRNQNYKRATATSGTFPNCQYRAPNGNKCAFGHALPDDLYDSSREGWTASRYMTELAFKLGDDAVFGPTTNKEALKVFANKVQMLHDDDLNPRWNAQGLTAAVDAWEDGMRELAEKYAEHGVTYVPPTHPTTEVTEGA